MYSFTEKLYQVDINWENHKHTPTAEYKRAAKKFRDSYFHQRLISARRFLYSILQRPGGGGCLRCPSLHFPR